MLCRSLPYSHLVLLVVLQDVLKVILVVLGVSIQTSVHTDILLVRSGLGNTKGESLMSEKSKKTSSIEDLIAGLKPPEEKYVNTGCLPFDMLTGGRGMRLGYLYQLYSSSNFGKSTFMLSVCRSLANRNMKSIYVASENNDELARSMGLKDEKYKGLFNLYPIMTYKDLEKITWAFLDSDYSLMVIDSITACFPSKLAEEDVSIEDSLPGINARIRGDYLRIINGMVSKKDKTIVYLNQTRANFDSGWNGEAEKAEGGYANKFYCMLQATIRGDAKVPDIASGEDKKIVGKQGYLICPTKNRCAPPGASIPFRVFFGKGVSNNYTLTHFCLWKGLITNAGAWFNCCISDEAEEEKVQGKVGRDTWVKNNQDSLFSVFYENAEAYYQFLLTDKANKLVI